MLILKVFKEVIELLRTDRVEYLEEVHQKHLALHFFT
jgi:hypothetical protein